MGLPDYRVRSGLDTGSSVRACVVCVSMVCVLCVYVVSVCVRCVYVCKFYCVYVSKYVSYVCMCSSVDVLYACVYLCVRK